MITASPIPGHPERWQRLLAEAVTDPAELVALLGLDPALVAPARRAAARFGLRVPRGFVARMRRGDPGDPLLRQVLPLAGELEETAGYVADPVADLASEAAPGLLHKYAGRALLVTTGACGVHCRYCFRREYPYADHAAAGGRWREAVAAIAADPSIHEAILSGGDPLSLGNARLAAMVEALADIPQLRRLRIHTRQPIVLPERVDEGLLELFRHTRLTSVVVVHANHAAEIDDSVAAALGALAGCGATLLNQSVLLAGVNDSVESLASLSERLAETGVLPYYLHLLDRVRGAAHFEVPEPVAVALVEGLRQRLPGYLVPRLVREEPGAGSKTPVA
jgi:EF-P beta-lysylation protein EpmB